MRLLIWNRICQNPEYDVIYPIAKPDPKPKKCSQGSPCKHDYEDDDYEDHPDCGESDYGTSVCKPDGYFFLSFSLLSGL